jgi:hypothetical protein
MKTKLFVTILLSVIGLLLVVGGVSRAQPLDDQPMIHPSTISNTVYLPITQRPPCTYVPHIAMYASVNRPVVKVDEIVTFTGVLVNKCTPVIAPIYSMNNQPGGILSPSSALIRYYSEVPYGSHPEITFAAQAIGTGVVTVTVGVNYVTLNPVQPGVYYRDIVEASPIVMQVLP